MLLQLGVRITCGSLIVRKPWSWQRRSWPIMEDPSRYESRESVSVKSAMNKLQHTAHSPSLPPSLRPTTLSWAEAHTRSREEDDREEGRGRVFFALSASTDGRLKGVNKYSNTRCWLYKLYWFNRGQKHQQLIVWAFCFTLHFRRNSLGSVHYPYECRPSIRSHRLPTRSPIQA